jgi:ABC-type branched-subunit amino acid transport system substrate-binding protein
MRMRSTAALAATVVLCAGITGCGGDDSSADSTAGLTGESIKLMSIIATGTNGANYEPELAAARASVRAINERGGIGGRPLELLYCNEQNEATAAEECARQAAEEEVVAVVAYSSARGAAQVHTILEAAGIPILAGQALSGQDFSAPLAFNVDGGAVVAFTLCGSALAAGGAEVLGMTRADLDSAAALEPLTRAGILGAGAEDSGQVIKIPQTATDFSSYVRTLDDAGVQGVISALAAPQQIQLLQTGAQIGDGLRVCADQANMEAKSLRDLGDVAGNFYAAGLPPLTKDSEVPGVAEFVEELKAEEDAGDADAAFDLSRASAFRAWEGPRMLERVASSVQGPLTAASLVSALQQNSALEVDMFGTVDFTTPGTLQPAIRNTSGYLTRWDPESESFQLLHDEPVDALPMIKG